MYTKLIRRITIILCALLSACSTFNPPKMLDSRPLQEQADWQAKRVSFQLTDKAHGKKNDYLLIVEQLEADEAQIFILNAIGMLHSKATIKHGTFNEKRSMLSATIIDTQALLSLLQTAFDLQSLSHTLTEDWRIERQPQWSIATHSEYGTFYLTPVPKQNDSYIISNKESLNLLIKKISSESI